MKRIFVFAFFITFIACSSIDKYSKNDYIGAKKIGNDLYWETYCIYRGGVYAGNTYTRYLTDSITFRLYLGSFEDHEQIGVTLIYDNIIRVRKYDINTDVTIEKKEYDLFDLKQEGKFE